MRLESLTDRQRSDLPWASRSIVEGSDGPLTVSITRARLRRLARALAEVTDRTGRRGLRDVFEAVVAPARATARRFYWHQVSALQ